MFLSGVPRLLKIGGITFFRLAKGDLVPMDPLTATQMAISSFFNFLATPAGQTAVETFIALDAAFLTKLKDLFDKIHGQATTPAPAPKV